MNTNSERKSRSVRIKTELDKHLENLAKKENRSVNNLIETLLTKASDFRELNEDTKQSIEEAIKEKSSQKRYTDMDQLFKDLGK
ncbi:hypothetical protein [Aquiflexum sp.]|uniref:hypothetical protein n=1 Tax=Aquiflexum sp. TaxID=1872584 RepID=UPI00359485D8